MVAFSAAMAGAFRDAEMVAGACHMLEDERSLWTVVVIGGFGASRGPAEKIIVPNRPAENAMVAFSAAMADASAMRGWPPEPATCWTTKGPYGRWS